MHDDHYVRSLTLELSEEDHVIRTPGSCLPHSLHTADSPIGYAHAGHPPATRIARFHRPVLRRRRCLWVAKATFGQFWVLDDRVGV